MRLYVVIEKNYELEELGDHSETDIIIGIFDDFECAKKVRDKKLYNIDRIRIIKEYILNQPKG